MDILVLTLLNTSNSTFLFNIEILCQQTHCDCSTLHSHQWPAISNRSRPYPAFTTVPYMQIMAIYHMLQHHGNEHNTFAFASPYAVIIMPQSTEKNERHSNALGGGAGVFYFLIFFMIWKCSAFVFPDVKKACFLDATKRMFFNPAFSWFEDCVFLFWNCILDITMMEI